ncbi:subclass B1 metallo-beta-lactamase [Mucilaginibacter terrae]|uniref:beta-lactamase n=1 Tax=Mucilaginibacter terrae TaxID=1955052 RepID=A0ABU3H2I4_9SPHI|nr:subclass B1 metallo-beta-lactamase [Mucilaginibacter terrae]MDT3405125.1 metallo-beta-lactamase class B [Mucilaginibacter terrae]
MFISSGNLRVKLFLLLIGLGINAVHAQVAKPAISTANLNGNYYVYTSQGKTDDKSFFPANGLYVLTSEGVILVDTPWDEEQTRQLADSIEKKHHQKIAMCIVTHHHADRTAGLDWLRKKGVKTYSSLLTHSLCEGGDEKQAQYTFKGDTTLSLGNVTLQTYYPGAGHSMDNLVVWFPNDKVLFGGCLIRSFEAKANPEVPGADFAQWAQATKKLFTRYGDAAFVIPGHQSWEGGTAMLSHTMIVLSRNQAR